MSVDLVERLIVVRILTIIQLIFNSLRRATRSSILSAKFMSGPSCHHDIHEYRYRYRNANKYSNNYEYEHGHWHSHKLCNRYKYINGYKYHFCPGKHSDQ